MAGKSLALSLRAPATQCAAAGVAAACGAAVPWNVTAAAAACAAAADSNGTACTLGDIWGARLVRAGGFPGDPPQVRGPRAARFRVEVRGVRRRRSAISAPPAHGPPSPIARNSEREGAWRFEGKRRGEAWRIAAGEEP